SHVRDAAEFSDVKRHRSDAGRPSTGDPGRAPSSRDRYFRGCRSEALEDEIQRYDWSTLAALVDIEHEIENIGIDEAEAEGCGVRNERITDPTRRLMVVGDLELASGRSSPVSASDELFSGGPGGLPPAPEPGLFASDIKAPKSP